MGRALALPTQAECVVGDLTKPVTLVAAVEGIDAIVFTHGGDGGGNAAAEQVDYGGVRNVLHALGGRTARIALMTAIGVTDRTGAFNRATQIHDWKRRGERLVRAKRLAVHDRAARLVRPPGAGPGPSRLPAGRHAACRQPERRRDRAPADRRGAGGAASPPTRRCAQDLRAGRRTRPGTE